MTSDNACNNLDSYFLGELDAARAAQFETHVRECPACRGAIEQQRWLDSLLQSPERLELESPPGSILGSFRAGMAQRRRNVRLAACGLAAAAAVMVAVGWTMLNRQANGPNVPVLAHARQADGETAPMPEPPRATFDGGPDMIVVPIASTSPNVTVVRIYPTYQTTFAERANDKVDSTEEELAWPNAFNGG